MSLLTYKADMFIGFGGWGLASFGGCYSEVLLCGKEQIEVVYLGSISAMPLTSCVTMGKLLGLCYVSCKMRIIVVLICGTWRLLTAPVTSLLIFLVTRPTPYPSNLSWT